MGWMIQGLNPGGGKIFRPSVDWPWGPPSLLYRSFFEVKQPGHGIDYLPHLAPRLKKE